jgi:hypothetical protein
LADQSLIVRPEVYSSHFFSPAQAIQAVPRGSCQIPRIPGGIRFNFHAFNSSIGRLVSASFGSEMSAIEDSVASKFPFEFFA